MKILLLTDSLDVGGAETHLLSLAKALRRRGHRVTVASSGGRLSRELSSLDIPHLSLPLSKNPLALALSYLSLSALIKSGGFDLIHSHARLPSFLASSIATRNSIPLICTAHAKFSLDKGRRVLSRWGDLTIAVSEDLKQYLILEYGIAPENITVIPNGIDTEAFSPSPAAVLAPTIAFLSRLDGDCSLGAQLLCRIAPRLVKKFGRLHIKIGGGGSELKKISEFARKINSALSFECITLVGEVRDSSEFLRSSDIFVGVSRAAMEAGLCGLPVILCGNEGFAGLLTAENFDLAASSNFCGRGLKIPDENALFSALCDAISSPVDTERVRLLLKEGFDAETTAEQTLSVYRSSRIPSRKSSALLCGYYGFGNMGDDILLRSAIERARRELPELTVGALTQRPRRDGARFGVLCKSRRLPLWVLRCKYLIFGGGTLFQEDTSLRSLCYYSMLLLVAKARGAKIYLWGNGLGRPRSHLGRALTSRCLDSADYIGLRDKKSLALARSLSDNPNIFLEGDLAEGAPPCTRGRADFLLAKMFGANGSPPPFIIVAPRKRGKWRSLLSALKKAKADGLRLVFVAMCPKTDSAVARSVCERTGGHLLEGIGYSDLVGIAAQSQGVYSMRLHALIAARSAGVPFHAFSSDDKIKGYLAL